MLLILAHVVSTTDDLEETGRVLDGRMETFGCLLMQHSMHCNELGKLSSKKMLLKYEFFSKGGEGGTTGHQVPLFNA